MQNTKPVIQYSLNNEFIKEWNSYNLAAKELNLNNVAINRCLLGKTKTSGKYKWKYKKYEK